MMVLGPKVMLELLIKPLALELTVLKSVALEPMLMGGARTLGYC